MKIRFEKEYLRELYETGRTTDKNIVLTTNTVLNFAK